MLASAAFSGLRAGVEVPGVVDRPQLVGRDELLQARERRDVFVVALFGRRAPGSAVAAAEPVGRRSPAVGPRHIDAVPMRHAVAVPAREETVSTVAFCQCRSARMSRYLASTSGGGRPSLPLAQMNADAWVAQHLDL